MPKRKKKGSSKKAHGKAPASTALAKREASPIERIKTTAHKLVRRPSHKPSHRGGGTRRMEKSHGGKGHPLAHIAAGIAGGAAGAAAGGLLVKAGVGPTLSAGIVTATGGAGAYVLDGYGKSASIGAAASGAGQLALTLMAKKPAQQHGQGRKPPPKRRNELPPAEVYRAMEEARREIGPPPHMRNDNYDHERNAPVYHEEAY